MATLTAPRSGWRLMTAVIASGLVTAGCGCTRQIQVQTAIASRKPIDPSLYELTFDECGVNTEPITGGYEDIPAGRGYQYQLTITNRDDRTRQFELRVTVTDVDDTTRLKDIPVTNTHRLAPGESETIERQGWISFESNGLTCEAELWPSILEILNPPPDS